MTDKEFDAAFRALPACIGGVDPLAHETVADLVWLCRHEVDLFEEGEETGIRTRGQLRRVKDFIRKYGA